jgi:hypothetical protein
MVARRSTRLIFLISRMSILISFRNPFRVKQLPLGQPPS